jgi:methyl-accepting chemotaxis protein
MPITDSQFIQLIIIAVAGLAVVMQAVILLLIFLSLKKGLGVVQREIAELRASVAPLLRNSQDFLARVGPKIETTTTDISEMVRGLRDRIAQLESSTTTIVDRLERQTARVDTMMTGVLDSLERVGGYVAVAINKPLRQVAGVLASIKAMVESLRTPAPEPAAAPTPVDTDTYV